MKTLVLVRHAKSSWEHNLTDLDRPLSERGFSDAEMLSHYFKNYNFHPNYVFSSPANRALTTCNIFMEALNLSKKMLSVDHQLYDFGGQQVSQFIKSLDDNYQNVMIFGHNHAFTAISNIFGNKFIDNVPTCGLVMIEFDTISWKTIDKGHTKLTLFPKELR